MIMLHQIIKASDIETCIESLINTEENRPEKIALLKLNEVKLYIATVKIMREDLEKIESFLKIGITRPQSCDLYRALYKGYQLNMDKRQGNAIITISPDIALRQQQLTMLLIELEQQKEHLEKLEKSEDTLLQTILVHHYQRVKDSLSEPLSESLQERIEQTIDSIKDGQNKVALEALQAYHNLFDHNRKLAKEHENLQHENKKNSDLLQKTLNENERLAAKIKSLDSNIASLTVENNKLREVSLVHEPTPEIKLEPAPVQQPTPLAAINRSYLVDLLNKFNATSRYPFFYYEKDPILSNLNKFLNSTIEWLTLSQLKDYISDPLVLSIFNDPHLYPDQTSLTRSQLIIRELAFIFRDQKLLQLVPKTFN